MSDEEYEGLSPEEIAAIKEDDDNPDDNPNDEPDGNPDPDDPKDNPDDGPDDDPKDDLKDDPDDPKDPPDDPKDTPDDDPKDNDPKDDLKDDEPKEPEEKPEPAPFIPTVPGVDQAKLDDLKAKLDEAQKQFADGDIDYAALDKVKDEYNKAEWMKESAEKQNKATGEQRWQWEQERFLDDNKQFSAEENETLHMAFVSVVNHLITTEESQKMTDKQILQAAKKQVEKDLGITRQDTDADKEAERKKKEALKNAKKEKATRDKNDVDIGSLPAAEDNSTDVEEFAHLDRLQGEAYQKAIDALSPAQREKYENAA